MDYIYQLVDRYGLIYEENRNKRIVQEAMERGYNDLIRQEGLHIVRRKEVKQCKKRHSIGITDNT